MEEYKIDQTLEVIREALENWRVNDAIAALVRLHPADRAGACLDLDDRQEAPQLSELDISAMPHLLEELGDDDAAGKLGIDPTVMSAPVIATLLDATGLLSCFSVAGLWLTQL